MNHYVLTVIADQVSDEALREARVILARNGIQPERERRLSPEGSAEILASARDSSRATALKHELKEYSTERRVDIAFQAETRRRRDKKLVAFDMDSTLIQCEVVDELARQKGVYNEISTITNEAMNGLIDFDESLRRRCARLSGLTTRDLEEVYERIQLTPGAEEVIRAVRALGAQTAIISGGFTFAAERLQERLRIDYICANVLEMQGEISTGKVQDPIVNARGKAAFFEKILKTENIRQEESIAIGDGANDLLMLEKSGLGIAFNAKPVVREKAKVSLTQKSLKPVLYLLGLSDAEIEELGK